MAAQSFAMGHAFGTSFQYGKRKISSMTNEEFNALSATDLHGELQADIRAMIPNMNQSFKTMEQFQLDIIGSMVETLRLAATQFFEFLTTGKLPSVDNTSTETSTSAFDVLYGGSITIPNTLLNDVTPDEVIEKLAKDYMDATGLTDFELAKQTIKNDINTKKEIAATQAATTKANAEKLAREIKKSRDAAKRITAIQTLDTSVRPSGARTGQFKTAAQHQATTAANKKALQSNLKTAIAKAKLADLEYQRFKKFAAPRIASTRQAAKRARLIKDERLLLNIRRDLNQKVTNLQRLLRNFR